MKDKKRLKQDKLPPLSMVGYALAVLAVFAVKAALASQQRFYTWIDGAPLDDELYFHAAQSITAGNWLGEYNYLTLSKHPLFALWLAALQKLGLPYLIAGQLLWTAAALAMAAALAPALKTRWRQLAVFGVLAFLPSASASYTLRVYRDNIFPALCLLFFAGLTGYALRAAGRRRKSLPWLLLAGAGLAAAWLCREDGVWLLPFWLAGGLVLAVLLWRRMGLKSLNAWARVVALALPGLVLVGSLQAVAAKNEREYGVRVVSDFSTGSFAQAIGAMVRVKESETVPLVSVPAEVRELLYENVEALRPLRCWLEEDPQMRNDFVNPEVGDYQSGSFYWAIRRAAQYEGVYDTAQKAQAYWAGVAEEINRLCDEGVLPSEGGVRSGTTPPVRAENVLPTLAETAKSLSWCATFQDCAPYRTDITIGTAEDVAVWEAYLHTGANLAAQAGTANAYYNPVQKAAYGLLTLLRWGYAVCLPLALLAALWVFVRRGLALLHGGRGLALLQGGGGALLWWLELGFLGMALFRAAMMAFMEVASFHIGTYVMYLATVHPLLALFAAAVLLAGPSEEKEAPSWDI